ncbi:hypothetical protein C8Q79DRAFT_915508 [Trametes meyenii]|nr:hypothetical protein C8Q79DRAFT_915508 [Trametes meyenii]
MTKFIFTHPLAIALMFTLALANAGADFALVQSAKQAASRRTPPLSQYSFVEDDYPPHLPLPNARRSVALALEESARYDPRHAESPQEWAYASPPGDANIRLGPTNRFFNTGFAYEIHCLRVLVGTLRMDAPPSGRGEREHNQRCLNVLRQFALCSADTALEPAGSLGWNFTQVRVGGVRQCRDWEALYEETKNNWVQWKAYQKALDSEARWV